MKIIPYLACLFLVTCASIQFPIGQEGRFGKFVIGYEAPSENIDLNYPLLDGFKK